MANIFLVSDNLWQNGMNMFVAMTHERTNGCEFTLPSQVDPSFPGSHREVVGSDCSVNMVVLVWFQKSLFYQSYKSDAIRVKQWSCIYDDQGNSSALRNTKLEEVSQMWCKQALQTVQLSRCSYLLSIKLHNLIVINVGTVIIVAVACRLTGCRHCGNPLFLRVAVLFTLYIYIYTATGATGWSTEQSVFTFV